MPGKGNCSKLYDDAAPFEGSVTPDGVGHPGARRRPTSGPDALGRSFRDPDTVAVEPFSLPA
jgi:hypothetical protein